MTKKLLGLLLSAIILPAALSAQSGKLAGKVTDSKTGEALALVNVLVEGTTMGAATNENGEYTILNVPPGSYTVKARYLGYADQAIAGIVVNVGLTKTVNFKLTMGDLTTGEVVVTADRPLINPNTTNATAIKTAEDIENLPVRGVANIVALQGGLVAYGGTVYVRGGRADETAYTVDGVNVTGAMSGGARLALIDNAIEEIQVQTGGHGAEFGGANGGVVSTTMKTGGSSFKFGAEFLTDGFGVNANSTILGLSGFSRGYQEYVGTVSGPAVILPNLNFYVAGRYQKRVAPAEFWNGYSFNGVPVQQTVRKYDNSADSTRKDTINVSYPKYRLDNDRSQMDLNGNVTYNFSPFSLKYTIAMTQITAKGGTGLFGILNRARVPESTSFVQSHAFKLSHTVDQTMFYTLTGSFLSDQGRSYDPKFKNNIYAYGDPAKNPSYVWNNTHSNVFRNGGAFNGPAGYNWTSPGTNASSYSKSSVTTISFKGDVVKQFGRVHEVKGGFEYNTTTIRSVSVDPTTLPTRMYALDQDLANPSSPYYQLNKADQNKLLARQLSANNYGYDIWGNEINGGLDGAKKPVFMAVYASDKLEYQDLILNLGLRYDYIDNQSFAFKNANNTFYSDDATTKLGYITDNSLTFKKAVSYVSPRIGLSMPVTDRTTFTANFGKYVQQSNLRDIYLGTAYMSRILLSGGNAFSNPVGFALDPTRTTSYEIGFKQQVTDNAAFDLTAYYNNKEGQIQIREIAGVRDGVATRFYAYQNGDYATASGVQLAVTLRRTNRIQSNFNYTYSDARSTGSSSGAQFRTVWLNGSQPFFPNYESSLSYNQTHSGSLEVDYRFANNDGPEVAGMKLLENFGVNVLYKFNSGHPFTRYTGYVATASAPTESFNSSSTPWVNQIDMRIDKSFKVSDFNLNAYIRIENLLNVKNVLDVFGQTGTADDDGWLATEEAQKQKNSSADYKKFYVPFYNAFSNQNNPGFFNSPRTVTLGLKLDF